MSDTIRILARKAAAAKDEGKYSRVIELYKEACDYAPDGIENVRGVFAASGVVVSGRVPRNRPRHIYMLRATKA